MLRRVRRQTYRRGDGFRRSGLGPSSEGRRHEVGRSPSGARSQRAEHGFTARRGGEERSEVDSRKSGRPGRQKHTSGSFLQFIHVMLHLCCMLMAARPHVELIISQGTEWGPLHQQTQKNQQHNMMMASAASSRRHGLLRRSPIHLRFLLVLAIKLLLIEGSESFAITERSWQYK